MTPLKPQDILTFKLKTGEEVIVKLLHESDMYYEVSNPLVIIMTKDGNLGMQHFMMTANEDANVKIIKDNVVAYSSVDPELEKNYKKNTSKIELLTPGSFKL